VAASQDAIQSRGFFSVALSGGSTPKTLFQLLASPEWKSRVDWSKAQIFWGDERMVPPDDPESNYRMTNEALLSHIDIPAQNIHRVMTESGTPDAVAADYERTIRQVFHQPSGVPQFDLVLLGLGANGHTASLFPHRPVLHEQQKLVAADHVEEVGMDRITMTLPLLNHARTVEFLISGAGKADVVRDVVAGPRQPEQLPAQLIQPDGGVLLYLLDRAAAAKLPPELLSSTSAPGTQKP
jgi:6-phosphogluconolactonase